MSAAPTTMRTYDAQLGGLSRPPPSRLDTSTKIKVRTARPTTHPTRNANPLGLAREERWLTAITSGEVAAVESILSRTFGHVNADGEKFERGQELAAMKPLPLRFDASDQIVDVYGDTAVIHGINTVPKGSKVV